LEHVEHVVQAIRRNRRFLHQPARKAAAGVERELAGRVTPLLLPEQPVVREQDTVQQQLARVRRDPLTIRSDCAVACAVGGGDGEGVI
jgi:hypothetical protein